MATRTKRPAAKRGGAAPQGRASANAGPVPAAEDAPKPNLLKAGLRALGSMRDDVVQHQSRVFEAILGLDPGQGGAGPKRDPATAEGAPDTFGLRKFEAVFDQRVVRALERLGVPSADDIQALKDELAALKAELRRLKARSPKR